MVVTIADKREGEKECEYECVFLGILLCYASLSSFMLCFDSCECESILFNLLMLLVLKDQ